MMEISRWQKLMDNLHLASNEETFDAIVEGYNEKHRRYHNAHHLKSVLEQFDSAVDLVERPDEMELALWFHDVIYKPFRPRMNLTARIGRQTFW